MLWIYFHWEWWLEWKLNTGHTQKKTWWRMQRVSVVGWSFTFQHGNRNMHSKLHTYGIDQSILICQSSSVRFGIKWKIFDNTWEQLFTYANVGILKRRMDKKSLLIRKASEDTPKKTCNHCYLRLTWLHIVLTEYKMDTFLYFCFLLYNTTFVLRSNS